MKVSRRVYYLVLIIEECAETIHRVCKAIRFGLDERWKPESKTNSELIEEELLDLEVIRQLNIQAGNIRLPEYEAVNKAISKKRARVKHYLDYSSKECGTVTEDEGMNAKGVYSLWKESHPVPDNHL